MKSFINSGEPQVLISGAALTAILLMTVTLMGVIMINGLGFFWPADLLQLQLKDGSKLLGQISDHERNPTGEGERLQLKTANRDLSGQDFRWLEESEIASRTWPVDAVVIERHEQGNFFGFLRGVNGKSDGDLWQRLSDARKQLAKDNDAIEGIAAVLSDLSFKNEQLRLKALKLSHADESANAPEIARLNHERDELASRFNQRMAEMNSLVGQLRQQVALVQTADGTDKEIVLADMVRVYQPNRMSYLDKGWFYLTKIRELLFDEPRESNTEGGLFPAIFGTILMVFLMSLVTLPFGVMAAVYLREYAKEGTLVRLVRIAVNNLAGVPSIVYGVFGLGFFVYGIGASIDRLFFAERLPTPTFGTGGILWSSLTLALLTLPVVIVATEEGLAAIPKGVREGSLSLGATRFQTLTRILLPMATPGIMTGLILSMARAAGEVAPLMLVGVVKLAPTLPFDRHFPFFHMDRKFMHLGFHIYDVGFQSPNVEAAKPMVFVTTILLLAIIIVASSSAIFIRNRMRKRFSSGTF
ncbi:MAG TPA: phosphate ABC transporter permease PstA [Geobacterales bacterium]|nr:phosphate ABC transporter permease PstA [Geobacterales bacterium]